MKALWPPSAVTWRQLPGAVLQAAIFGAITGPPLGLMFNWLLQQEWESLLRHPIAWLIQAALIGVSYSVTFYLTCALPLNYVGRRLRSAPRRYARVFIGLAGFVCGTFGAVIVLGVLSGVVGRINATLFRIAVIDGIIAMILAVALNAWRREEAERRLSAARLQFRVLQAQINPHFFFNTLNTISALIPIAPGEAQRTLGLFADLSRYAFTSSQTETVSLALELDFVRAYLEIEKARFRSRLRFDLPDASTVSDINLPALSLQPLIENAVRYGITPSVEGGSIAVRIDRQVAGCSLTVENEAETPPDLSDAAFFRPDHSLSNIRERLRLMYQGRASIQVAAPQPHRVAVTIYVPWQQAA